MKVFQIAERLVMSRMWSMSADTAHAALARFHEGKATFIGNVPDHRAPLVTIHVIDKETGQEFTEEQLDREMAALEGPYASGEELAAALTIPPPANAASERAIDLAAMAAELDIDLRLEDIAVEDPNHVVFIRQTTLYSVKVKAGDRSDAYDAGLAAFQQSANPLVDFGVENTETEVAMVGTL